MAPRKLIDEPDFRVVEDVVGGQVMHVLEVKEGLDAMGGERWRVFRHDASPNLKAIFGYLIRVALELEAIRHEHR